jgi:muramoyltetrapeptide carboxypeptidase
MKVKKLVQGDTIGFICPSTKMDMGSDRIPRLETIINKLGYKIKYGLSCNASEGYLAGTDELRVNDIHEMFLDPEIKAIICMKGGYGASRIVDKIDYQIIKDNPKLFMGFSDITVLLNNFSKYASLPTIHGQVGIFLGRENIDEISLNDFTRLLSEDMSGRLFHNNEARCLNPGIASGKIVGGNLTLITNLIGSKYDIDFHDNIVFIEEVDEHPYKIDRMLAQLRLSGKLSQAKGFIFGHFTNCETPDNTQTVEQLINEYFKNLNVPLITNFASGHEFPFLNIPIGVEAVLNADKKELKIIGEIYEKN